MAAGAIGLLTVGAVVGAATVSGPASVLALGPAGSPSPGIQIGPIQLPIALPQLPIITDLLSPPGPAPTPTDPGQAPPPSPDASPSPAVGADGVPISSTVAVAAVSSVAVYADAGGRVENHLSEFNSIGQPQAFLVVSQSPGWYQVELPIKPVGSLGWVEASSVTTRSDPYFIRVHQSQFQLELYDNGQLVNTFPVAVGAPGTPTPNGNAYVWASQPWNQYPYAVGIFALSTFSPVLDNWPGGGRTGIHGWTDTSVLGKDASHGCVRMSGSDFAQLLNTVPLGTPVQIEAQ